MNMCFTLLSCNKLIHIITQGGIEELKKETKEMIDETIELPEKKSCSCFSIIVNVNDREEETEMSERLGMGSRSAMPARHTRIHCPSLTPSH